MGRYNVDDMYATSINWPVKAIIPLYIYPTYLGSFWDVIEANPTGVAYVVANVDSGPGATANSDYVTHIQKMQAKGVKVLGYIHTSYAGTVNTARTVAACTTDMDLWRSLYGVDGFFFDDCSNVVGTGNAQLIYYQKLYAAVKAISLTLTAVNNIGTTFPAAFMSPETADIYVSTENSETNLLANVPSTVGYEFMWSHPASQFCHLIYSGTAGNLQADFQAAVKRHAGYVYVTADTVYQAEPAFWAEQQLQLGGFGTLPGPQGISVITGSKGGNAALASLLTHLATLGLIVDQTT